MKRAKTRKKAVDAGSIAKGSKETETEIPSSPKPRPYLPFFLNQKPGLPPRREGSLFQDVETEELYCKELAGRFAELCRRANAGEEDALARLINLVSDGAAVLNRAIEMRPDLLKRWACYRTDWPLLLSPMQSDKNLILSAFKKIDLGSKALINISDRFYKDSQKKGWNYRTSRNQFAIRVVKIIEHNRRDLQDVKNRSYEGYYDYSQLPQWVIDAVHLSPFCRATVDKWLKVAWAMIGEICDDRPDTLPQLEEFGISRAKGRDTGTREGNLRDGIKRALTEGLKAIAPSEPGADYGFPPG